eukprot:11953120-Alexandrium_andersonii.AAC.1
MKLSELRLRSRERAGTGGSAMWHFINARLARLRSQGARGQLHAERRALAAEYRDLPPIEKARQLR